MGETGGGVVCAHEFSVRNKNAAGIEGPEQHGSWEGPRGQSPAFTSSSDRCEYSPSSRVAVRSKECPVTSPNTNQVAEHEGSEGEQ